MRTRDIIREARRDGRAAGRAAADQRPEGLGWARVGTIDGTSTWKRLRSNVDRLGCCARLMATPQLPIPREVPTR